MKSNFDKKPADLWGEAFCQKQSQTKQDNGIRLNYVSLQYLQFECIQQQNKNFFELHYSFYDTHASRHPVNFLQLFTS